MLTYWRGVFVMSLSALSLGACQVLSGLSGLEVEESGGPGVGGAGGAGGALTGITANSAASSSATVGVGGSTPCDMSPDKCVKEFISDTGTSVDFLGLVNNYIVWAQKSSEGSKDGQISRAPTNVEAPVPEKMPSKVSLAHFAADGDFLYWVEDTPSTVVVNSLKASSMTLPAPAPFATDMVMEKAQAFAAGEEKLFWSLMEKSTLRWVDTTGGTPKQLVDTMSTSAPTVLVVDKGFLYFNVKSPSEIKRMALTDGSPATVASTGTSEVKSIAMDDDFVYWTAQDGNNGLVYAVPKEMGSPALISMDLIFTTHIATDGRYIYWFQSTSQGCMGTSDLFRAKKELNSAGVTPVSSVYKCPSNFVQDENYIYFGADKKIYRLPKT